jgi:SSS family solute:Na+ symporter
VLVTVFVSLFTKPKPDSELTNLVMGLTPIPDLGPCPWYENPKLWAAGIMGVLIAINVIFW